MSSGMYTSGNWEQTAILVLIVAILLAAFALRAFSAPQRPQQWRPRYPYWLRAVDRRQEPNLRDVGKQLEAVMAASFERQRVLSAAEYRVFAIVEKEIALIRAGCRVFAQTSLGEVLRSSNSDAFRSINSKRVDILVVDRGGWPVLAVEYQGPRHYQGNAAARDAVKREALRKAGVRYIEFDTTDTEDQIRLRLREHLDKASIRVERFEASQMA